MPIQIDSTTLISFISAIATIAAVIVAYRANKQAKEAQKLSEESAYENNVIKIASIANEIILEGKSLLENINKLKASHKTLSVFTGNVGSSRSKLFLTEIDTKISIVGQLINDACLFANPTIPSADTGRVLIKLNASLVEINTIKISVTKELASIEIENSRYREQQK